jgi:hypothetical protein
LILRRGCNAQRPSARRAEGGDGHEPGGGADTGPELISWRVEDNGMEHAAFDFVPPTRGMARTVRSTVDTLSSAGATRCGLARAQCRLVSVLRIAPVCACARHEAQKADGVHAQQAAVFAATSESSDARDAAPCPGPEQEAIHRAKGEGHHIAAQPRGHGGVGAGPCVSAHRCCPESAAHGPAAGAARCVCLGKGSRVCAVAHVHVVTPPP